jgi:hypothetical protein
MEEIFFKFFIYIHLLFLLYAQCVLTEGFRARQPLVCQARWDSARGELEGTILRRGRG